MPNPPAMMTITLSPPDEEVDVGARVGLTGTGVSTTSKIVTSPNPGCNTFVENTCNIQIDSGNIRIDSGNIHIDSGNIQIDSGNIQVDLGNIKKTSPGWRNLFNGARR
jgi:hypothetical protein